MTHSFSESKSSPEKNPSSQDDSVHSDPSEEDVFGEKLAHSTPAIVHSSPASGFVEAGLIESELDEGASSRLMKAAALLDIIYEEGPIIAFNKPSGVLTQAPPDIDSMELRVKNYLILREEKPGKCYLGVPHRLDRPASGVLVFAKHVRAAHRLSEQFESRLVVKKYWALVQGTIEPDEGTWVDYMRKIPNRAEAELLQPIHPDAREAVLNYKVLRRFESNNIPITWLEIELETGRTHQIRLQCSSRGYPLLGDSLYNSTVPFGPQYEDERSRGIALHSRRMTFTHPQTRELRTLTAPISSVWRDILGDEVDLQ